MNGLVLQGGGAKGAYHLGVWKALREVGEEIHAVTGTSIGALNGVMIVQGAYRELEDLWLDIRPEMLFDIDSKIYQQLMEMELKPDMFNTYVEYIKGFFSRKGFDITPLKKLIDEMVDEDRVRNSEVDFGLVAYNASDLVPFERFVKDIPEGELKEYLLASAHLPFFQMEKIQGKVFVDGAFHDNQPVRLMTRKKGIRKIIIVDNKGFGLKQKVDLRNYEVVRINASGDTGGTLDLTRERALENIAMGYYDTLRVYRKLMGTRYVIRPFDEEEVIEYFLRLPRERVRALSRVLGKEPPVNQRQVFEGILPEIARLLKVAEEGSYADLILALAETAARRLAIDPYRIYEIRELLKLIKEALEKDEHKASKENSRFITKILKQGNIVIGSVKDEVILEIMAALLMEVD
jgi:NTE family protein